MTSRSLAALALAGLAAAALLAGCGRQGELERPAPLFGKASQPSPDALRRQQAASAPTPRARPGPIPRRRNRWTRCVRWACGSATRRTPRTP